MSESWRKISNGDGFVRVFPLKFPVAARRTHSQTLKHATLAVEGNTHIEGVKGPSILFLLPGYDFISGLVPDYMHCALLGVCFKF